MKAIKLKQRALLLAAAIISIILVCCTKTDMDIPLQPADSTEDAGRLYQKLIFVKNDTLNPIFPYLLSLIPDKNIDDNHQGKDIAGNFINLGDTGGFSVGIGVN